MNIFKNILRWGLWTCIFAVPFVPLLVANSMFFPYITGKNFAFRVLVEITLGLWVALAILDKDFRPKKSWLMCSFFAFTAIIAIADYFGANSFKSFWSNYERMEGFVTIAHLFAYFLVLGSALTEKMWKYVVWTSFAVAVIIGFIGLGQLGAPGTRIDATLGNSTYLGGYMLIHIFLVLYFFLKRVHKSVKDIEEKFIAFWYVLLGVFYAIVMYFTGTRGSLLAFLGGILVVAIILAITEKKHLVIRNISIGLIALVIILVGAMASVRGTEFAKSHPLIDRFSALATLDLKAYAENAGFSRFTLWKIALQGVKERPLLGWGQDNFTYVFAKYYDPKMYAQEQWFDRTHNVFLDWLIAGGVLGLLSYLSIFVVALWYLWKREEFDVPAKAVFTGLIVAYFIHNFFVFDNLTSYILIAIVLSYIHIKVQEDIPAFSGEIDSQRVVAYAIIPLLFIPFVVVFVNKDAYFANTQALEALVYVQSPQVPPQVVLDKFKTAIAYNSFGNNEIREQLVSNAARFMTKTVPDSVRLDWYNFAVSEAQKQIKQSNDSRTYIMLANFYAQIGDYENAIRSTEGSDKLFPKKPSTRMMLAELYAASKNYSSSENVLRDLIVLVPDYGLAKTTLARVLLSEGKTVEAKKLIADNATSTYAVGDMDLIQKFASVGEWGLVSDMLKVAVSGMGPGKLDYNTDMSLVIAYLKAGRKTDALNELNVIGVRFPERATTTEAQINLLKAGGSFI